jgi:hypothetical protein
LAGGALHRKCLRVTSSELPPPPGEPAEARKRQIQSPSTPPGPPTAAAALSECCSLVDALLAGLWNWPSLASNPAAKETERLSLALPSFNQP